jgi:hypothetical protein
MKLPFTHQGVDRTLNKNPKVQQALKRGQLTESDAKLHPWYLRATIGGAEKLFKLVPRDKDAIRAAKDILNGRRDQPTQFNAWLAARSAQHGLTLQQLADDWLAQNLPDDGGHPRDEKAQAQLRFYTGHALKWWSAKPAAAVTRAQMLDFATWRRARCVDSGRGTGDRSVDLELAALSCLCQWAVATEKIKANPFAKRPRFRRPDDVRHCHEFMPESDEVWHQLLAWFWTAEISQDDLSNRYHAEDQTRRLRVAGAWLAFCGLTGLRPEEPQFLFRHARLAAPPASPEKLLPGTVFPTRDGQLKMKIIRSKHGQNPYVVLHTAAAEFLEAWAGWLDSQFTIHNSQFTPAWFPDPAHVERPLCGPDFSLLNKRMGEACAARQIADVIKPKGFGRAFYVRVRRSQGADDATIASELGQTTNGKLIRETYGNPGDMVGGAQFDWRPETKDPAWTLFQGTGAADNIIRL